MDQNSGDDERPDYPEIPAASDTVYSIILEVDGVEHVIPEGMKNEDLQTYVFNLERMATSQRLSDEIKRQIVRRLIAPSIGSEGATDPLAPPKGGQLLLSMFTPLQRQEEVIGDLDERFVVQVARYGLAKAKIWYFTQTFYVSCAFGVRKALEVIGVAKLFGLIRS